MVMAVVETVLELAAQHLEGSLGWNAVNDAVLDLYVGMDMRSDY